MTKQDNIEGIKDLKRGIKKLKEGTDLGYGHQVGWIYREGIDDALKLINSFEAGLRKRLKEVIKLSKESSVSTSIIVLHELELELSRVIGIEMKKKSIK